MVASPWEYLEVVADEVEQGGARLDMDLSSHSQPDQKSTSMLPVKNPAAMFEGRSRIERSGRIQGTKGRHCASYGAMMIFVEDTCISGARQLGTHAQARSK